MKYRFLYALLSLVLAMPSHAQTIESKFKALVGSSGIGLGRINAISQDKLGMIWFSDETNQCVTRYDGTHMTRFVYDPLDSNSLGGDHPECITPDSTGTIWIGLYGAGLDKFDPETKTFTHFRHNPDDPGSLSSDTVSNVLIDHLGEVWIGTADGLDKMDQKTGKFLHFRNDPQDPTSLSCNRVRALYEDREGTIWIGTSYVWDSDKSVGGLNRMDLATGKFTRYLHNPKNPHSLINNKVRVIFEDSRGTFWIGTGGDGLHTLDRKTGLFERHIYDPAKPENLSRPPLRRPDDHITFILEDSTKSIWIGTFGNGINRYNPTTKRVTHFGGEDRYDDFDDFSLWTGLVSKDGDLWIATQEDNTYQVEPVVTIRRQNEILGRHQNFYEESPSVLWFATARGAVRKDLQSGLVTSIVHDPLNSNSISSDEVNSVFRDREGNFWFGTENGLNRYNPTSKIIERFFNDPIKSESLTNNRVISVSESDASHLWIETVGGLDLLTIRAMTFKHFRHEANDTMTLGSNFITAVLQMKEDDVWVGAWNGGGLNRLNPQTGKVRRYLRGQSILEVCRDKENVMWVAAQNVLYRYDEETDTFSQFDTEIISSSINSIRSLIVDDKNNIWISTPSTLYRINPERNQIVQFGKRNGILPTSIVYVSSYKKSDGELYFGAYNEYYSFYPADLKLPNDVTKIMLTELWINGKMIEPNEGGPLKQSLSATEKIELSYDQNVFSVGFVTINFSDPAMRLTQCKLETYDKTWRPLGSEETVHYFNVPPGRYNFRIKVTDQSNGSSTEKSLIVVISPPWWRTAWANGMFVLMFGGMVYSVHRVQKSRVIRAERERTREKELAQAREIEKAYNDLKVTQDQLVQSEKMASLGELTAGIAHEIQNPLNFVNNFSEVNSELIAELKMEIEKGNLTEVKSIAGNIDENEKKIIFHGKRADAIVKGMLQHSRSSSGVKESTDINALADEYFRLAYHGLRAKDKSFNATMKTEFNDQLPKINVVTQEIGRVILNLITNAFYVVAERAKKGEAGYVPTVTVTTRKVSNKVEIRVKDNGNGIPQKVLDKIFQPFFTTKPAGQGTGLGLSLSYDIVKAHGGELKVETKEGVGAEFIVSLPV